MAEKKETILPQHQSQNQSTMRQQITDRDYSETGATNTTQHGVTNTHTEGQTEQHSKSTGATSQSGNTKGETHTGYDWDEPTQAKYREMLKELPNSPAATAFLKTYPKPDPKAKEEADDLARRKIARANTAEAIRLLIDMGSGAMGGNIYKRDGALPQVQNAKKEKDAADAKYQKALDEYNKGLYNANIDDIKRDWDLRQQLLLGSKYSTSNQDTSSKTDTNNTTDTTGKTKQDSTTTTNTTTNQTTSKSGTKPVVTTSRDASGSSSGTGGSGGGGKSSGNVEVLVNRVDPKTGKAAQVRYPITKEHWTLVKQKARQQLNRDPQVLRNAALQFVQAPTGKVTKTEKEAFEAKVTEMEDKIKEMLSLAKDDATAMAKYDTKAVDEMLQTIIPLIPDADSTLRSGVINDYGRGDARVSETQHEGDRTTRQQTSNNTTQTGDGGYDYTKIIL